MSKYFYVHNSLDNGDKTAQLFFEIVVCIFSEQFVLPKPLKSPVISIAFYSRELFCDSLWEKRISAGINVFRVFHRPLLQPPFPDIINPSKREGWEERICHMAYVCMTCYKKCRVIPATFVHDNWPNRMSELQRMRFEFEKCANDLIIVKVMNKFAKA